MAKKKKWKFTPQEFYFAAAGLAAIGTVIYTVWGRKLGKKTETPVQTSAAPAQAPATASQAPQAATEAPEAAQTASGGGNGGQQSYSGGNGGGGTTYHRTAYVPPPAPPRTPVKIPKVAVRVAKSVNGW